MKNDIHTEMKTDSARTSRFKMTFVSLEMRIFSLHTTDLKERRAVRFLEKFLLALNQYTSHFNNKW